MTEKAAKAGAPGQPLSVCRPRPVRFAPAGQTIDVRMIVNGTTVELAVPARWTLSDVLRDNLRLTGTHVGCEHGICGMCTVVIDGQAARACLILAVQVDGSDILTIEGLGSPGDLHPLQEAFGRQHALQCGFCTPGFVMSAFDLLTHQPGVSKDDLPVELSGVLCRCTGYRNIVDAVADVAQAFPEGIESPRNRGRGAVLASGPSVASYLSTTPSPDPGEAATVLAHPDHITMPQAEPTVTIHVTRELEASPVEVGRILVDTPVLARCLPGAELTDDFHDMWYAGRARVALGPVRLSFMGVAHVLEQTDRRILLRAQGRDTGGGGVQGQIILEASPCGDGTLLSASAEVHLSGRIASFGRGLAVDVSRRIFEEFARSIERTALGEIPQQSQPAGAFRLLMSTVVDRIRRRVERVRAWRPRRGPRAG